MKVNWQARGAKAVRWVKEIAKAIFSQYCLTTGLIIPLVLLACAASPYWGYVEAFSPFSSSWAGNNAPWEAPNNQGAMEEADAALDQLQSELAQAYPEVSFTHLRYDEIGAGMKKHWKWPMPLVLKGAARSEMTRASMQISDEDWDMFKGMANKGYQAFSFYWTYEETKKRSCLLVPGNIFIDDRTQFIELAGGEFSAVPAAKGNFYAHDIQFVNRHELMHCIFGDGGPFSTGLDKNDSPLSSGLRNESFADVAAALWMVHDGFSADLIKPLADARTARVWHGVKTASDPAERLARRIANLFSSNKSSDLDHYTTPGLDVALYLLEGPLGPQVKAMNLRQIGYLSDRIVKLYGAGGETPIDGITNVEALSQLLDKFEAGQCGSGTDLANLSNCGVSPAFLSRLAEVFPPASFEPKRSKDLAVDDLKRLITEAAESREIVAPLATVN